MVDIIAKPNVSIFFAANSGLAISAYAWQFPGGTPNTTTGSNPTVNYSVNGTYVATLDVVFSNGETGQDTAIIEIDDTAVFDGISVNGDYWNYDGNPKLLLGGFTGGEPFLYKQNDVVSADGSDELTKELNTLQAVGGNFIRCTMANWPVPYLFGKNIQDFPFTGGLTSFDLTSINQQYFDRLNALFTKAEARGIIVSVELWEPHNLPASGTWAWDGSSGNGDGISQYWNPKNNITYDSAASGLPTAGGQADNSSFTALTEAVLITAQKLFVDHICIEAAKHKNVIIQMENESPELVAWDNYWAAYINAKGLGILVTTMRDNYDLKTADAQTALLSSEYNYADSSQQWWTGETWKTMDIDREFGNLLTYHGVASKPINAVKVYSSFNAVNGYHEKAVDYFFMSIIAGNAGVAFHPGLGPNNTEGQSGNGLSGVAQRAIASGRWLADNTDIEINGNGALSTVDSRWSNRDKDSAYATKLPLSYVVFFSSVNSNGCDLDVSALTGTLQATWYNIDTGHKDPAIEITPIGGIYTMDKPNSTTRYFVVIESV